MAITMEELKRKAQRYDEAIESAKEIVNNQNASSIWKDWLRNTFPELKESEDEKIRKELIDIFKGKTSYTSEEDAKRYIAWLEKQGNTDKASYEIAEKEKYDFVSGQFIECRKSFNEFKEDNSYWFEYVGNDTYIGRSDNILNKKFHITPRQLYRLFTQQHSPKENNVNEETNAPTAYGKYVDECLNEAAKHFFSEGEDKYTVADLFYAGVRCGQSLVEKRCEQKPNSCNGCINRKGCINCVNGELKETEQNSDTIEPKFKVGDWIISNNNKYIYQVVEVKRGIYVVRDNADNREYCVGIESADRDGRLWTIQDAKKGDVLYSPCLKLLWIFKDKSSVYCGCNLIYNNGAFSGEGYIEKPTDAIPATKEQRDLLFQKMKEAGYEWDAVNKELKKISQRMISAEAKEAMYDKPACVWSEEDEKMLENCINALADSSFDTYEIEEWVKSLKQRIGG